MRKFITKILLIISPIIVIVICVNFFGDAANLFSIGYERFIANEIVKGNNVTNVSNYDERLLQKYLINDLKECPEVLILGSSRVMLINATNFDGQTFFNNGVTGASINDLLAIFYLYEQKGCIPKKLILGLDPWTVNINNGQSKWKTLNQEYQNMYNLLFHDSNTISDNQINSKYLQLVSPSYFQASLKKIFIKQLQPKVTKVNVNKTFTKLRDGSINYDEYFKTTDPQKVDARIRKFMGGYVYSLEEYHKLSPEIKLTLETFIAHLKSKNVDITFFLAPYHPKVYAFLAKTEKFKYAIESEKYYKDLGQKNGIRVLGSFNPARLNLDESYFYDAMHCNEKATNLIISGE